MIHVGQSANLKRTFSQEDFDRFAALSGDDNPIHVDPEFSEGGKFGRTVAHGMLLYSTVCAVLGTQLPGPGTLQLWQELMFPSPTYVGEEVTIRLEATQVYANEGWSELSTVITRPDSNLGLQGRTLVQLPGRSSPRPQAMAADQGAQQATASSLKGFKIGQQSATRRTFTAQDLAEYGDLTGDTNPIFADAEYARRHGLEGPIIPGGLVGGLFSFLLGTRLPGRGTNYLKQRLEFLTPAYVDQEITAIVKVIRLRSEKQLVNLSTVCTNPAGEKVCQGEALVLVSDVDAPMGTG
jgi:acyl dehydratase